uniref:Transforming acidic coiled-coil containing protein 1 n=1 Tax=Pelodiscus sinensis TaxID=13735 RepID=K7FKI0_PELSI
MAFSPWQILSPVQWARWTWSAVRGGAADGGEDEREMEEDDSQAETKSLSFSSDSEGNFETPEADTPLRSPVKEPCDPALGRDAAEAGIQEFCEDEERLVAEVSETYARQKHSEDEVQTPLTVLQPDTNSKAETDHRLDRVTRFAPETEALLDGSSALPAETRLLSSVELAPEQTLPPDGPVAPQERGMSGEGVVVMPEGLAETLALESVPSKSKLQKVKPSSLRKKAAGETGETEAAAEGSPAPKASHHFSPAEYDEEINPFPTPPPAAQQSFMASNCDASDSGVELAEESRGQALQLEFDFTDGVEGGEVRKALPKKSGRKPASKLTPKRQRDAAKKPASAEGLEKAPGEAPLPKASYTADPSQWDDPNFNPFGGSLRNSPPLPKASYRFDPNDFDSVDPFTPSRSLAGVAADSCPAVGSCLNEILEPQTVEVQGAELATGKASPKKAKSRLITSGCKAKKYEITALALDAGSQDEGALISNIPDVASCDGHATDEEKLASTSSSQKPPGPEVKGETEDDLEYFECGSVPVSAINHAFSSTTGAPQSLGGGGQGAGSWSCFPGSCNTLLLVLGFDKIITKEIEANEWKKKYEGSRQEVLEMRKIVAEYEKTIAQMIEDEQRTSMASQKSLQQLTAEKEQALADLNSVERSLSDLFRRYENLKGVLEGFKKNEEALKKCAQDYLARVRQEEQRYQALKIHAEEKLDNQLEPVTTNFSYSKKSCFETEAGLPHLESTTLKTNNQEIEELTKICDELIAKMGKAD